ncbi:hypothetical protein [Psychroflexus tropicus]|uniref:hypothetical protein n=1 Tax=Psychroflexus tropicus TaxID=197345 RepID=UPI003CCC3F5E
MQLKPSESNGLKRESLIRLNKFATVNKDLILGRLGCLEDAELKRVNISLLRILKLDT